MSEYNDVIFDEEIFLSNSKIKTLGLDIYIKDAMINLLENSSDENDPLEYLENYFQVLADSYSSDTEKVYARAINLIKFNNRNSASFNLNLRQAYLTLKTSNNDSFTFVEFDRLLKNLISNNDILNGLPNAILNALIIEKNDNVDYELFLLGINTYLECNAFFLI